MVCTKYNHVVAPPASQLNITFIEVSKIDEYNTRVKLSGSGEGSVILSVNGQEKYYWSVNFSTGLLTDVKIANVTLGFSAAVGTIEYQICVFPRV